MYRFIHKNYECSRLFFAEYLRCMNHKTALSTFKKYKFKNLTVSIFYKFFLCQFIYDIKSSYNPLLKVETSFLTSLLSFFFIKKALNIECRVLQFFDFETSTLSILVLYIYWKKGLLFSSSAPRDYLAILLLRINYLFPESHRNIISCEKNFFFFLFCCCFHFGISNSKKNNSLTSF